MSIFWKRALHIAKNQKKKKALFFAGAQAKEAKRNGEGMYS